MNRERANEHSSVGDDVTTAVLKMRELRERSAKEYREMGAVGQ